MQDDDEIDPGETCLKLARHAYAISTPSQIKDRIEENLESIEDWVGEKPKRQKMKVVKWDIDSITTQLMSFELKANSLEKVQNLLRNCKQNLERIRDHLGVSDVFYISISSAVARAAQNKTVEIVNRVGSSQRPSSVFGYSKNSEIYDAVKGALEIAFSLEEFDMDRDMKGAFRTNMDTIKSMARQLGISTSSPEEIRIREIWAAEEKKRQEAIRIKKEILRKK
jgi:hypothetical protein